jgi:membrane-associated phospholipid phosphatase
MIVYVLLWQVANYFLNAVLKNALRQPRPVGPLPSANIEYLERHKYYGMPSGHVQLVVSMGVLTMLVLVRARFPNAGPQLAALILAMPLLAFQMGVTMWQRVSYQRHDIPQVLVGGGLGAVFALLFYRVAYAYRK